MYLIEILLILRVREFGHGLKELAIFLIFVFILKSFHLPDSDGTGQTILRTQVIALHAGEMTSIANYEVYVTTSKCNIRRIFRLQKRAARVILGLKMRDQRTVTLFKRLDWLPFYDEINVNKLC